VIARITVGMVTAVALAIAGRRLWWLKRLAWATGKPLSPKQVILDPRDHPFAKAPWILAASDEEREALPEEVRAEAERPLVGEDGGMIDPDVLWPCTNCGACVKECPVDIEHVDHIDGMRRHQVRPPAYFADLDRDRRRSSPDDRSRPAPSQSREGTRSQRPHRPQPLTPRHGRAARRNVQHRC
jgi:Fe-S oxidoreductase